MHKPSTTQTSGPYHHRVTDDYEMSTHTTHMLRIYRDGDDAMSRDSDTGANEQANAITRYLMALDDYDKGESIIDLLTLVDALQHTILTMQNDAMTS